MNDEYEGMIEIRGEWMIYSRLFLDYVGKNEIVGAVSYC